MSIDDALKYSQFVLMSGSFKRGSKEDTEINFMLGIEHNIFTAIGRSYCYLNDHVKTPMGDAVTLSKIEEMDDLGFIIHAEDSKYEYYVKIYIDHDSVKE